MAADAMHDFVPGEYARRLAALALRMRGAGFAARLFNSAPNRRYVTGHWTGRRVNASRPILSVLDDSGAATILCSRIEQGMAGRVAYLRRRPAAPVLRDGGCAGPAAVEDCRRHRRSLHRIPAGGGQPPAGGAVTLHEGHAA